MKTRKGFVTNSSSTSYVLVGVPVEHKKLADITNNHIPPSCRMWVRMFDYASPWCNVSMGTDVTMICPGDELHEIIATFLAESVKYPNIISGFVIDITIGILQEGRSVSKNAVKTAMKIDPGDPYLYFDTGSFDNNSTNTADEFVEHYAYKHANLELYKTMREMGMEPPDALRLTMEHTCLIEALRGMGSSEKDAIHIALKEIGHED